MNAGLIGGLVTAPMRGHALFVRGGGLSTVNGSNVAYGSLDLQNKDPIFTGRTRSVTGKNSLAVGQGNAASGINSIATGEGVIASGEASSAFGYQSIASATGAVALGSGTAGHAFSVSLLGSSTGANYQLAHGFAVTAQAISAVRSFGRLTNKAMEVPMHISTTDATPTELRAGQSNNERLTLENDSTYVFTILLTARRTDANDESAAYKFEGCIDRNASAATTALVGSVTKTVIAEDTAAWDADVTADATNGALAITVTGENAKSITWCAIATLVSVTG